MLKLYYSGAKKENGASNANQSMGGFISSTGLTNSIGNLFGPLSSLTIQTNKPEHKAIVLTNTGPDDMIDLSAWFIDITGENSDEFDDSKCEFEIGYANLQVDDCGELYFPYSITNTYQAPLGVTFQANKYGQGNAISLPPIESGMSLGIWIKRKIKASALQPLTDDTLCAISSGDITLPTSENIDLVFDWTDSSASL